uniref:SFRICE_020968 n=1 Tax=Spodoptera frugiperda TaxID=7108 RepID=A0A2H1WC40_SPOFR
MQFAWESERRGEASYMYLGTTKQSRSIKRTRCPLQVLRVATGVVLVRPEGEDVHIIKWILGTIEVMT